MNLTQWLFDTNALRICPDDSPFWYTSGTIGPYYINTHFLCGGESIAGAILGIIDDAIASGDKLACPERVSAALEAEIAKEGIFAQVIEMMISTIKDRIPLDDIGYISGGERRDWFFSLPVAKRLGLPHISIYKDLSAALSEGDKHYPITALESKAGVLHIADLITEASSYERAWVPAIETLGGKIADSLVVIDRVQGGEQKLSSLGINHHALAAIDIGLFETALEQQLISLPQYKMVAAFIDNPHDSMREFLITHPDFMHSALSGDERTAGRARLCLEKDIYGIADMFR